jgi:hypothetical protein
VWTDYGSSKIKPLIARGYERAVATTTPVKEMAIRTPRAGQGLESSGAESLGPCCPARGLEERAGPTMSSLMKSRSCKSSWCSSNRSCRLSFLAYPPKTNHAAKRNPPASHGTIELPIELTVRLEERRLGRFASLSAQGE